MTTTVAIGQKKIGPAQPIYIIAEVGTTCLGDMEKALKLIAAGAAAGVDAVKFQVIDPDQDSNKKSEYAYSSNGQAYKANMQEMFSRLQFNKAEWARIAQACKDAGVDFFATVDYVAGVEMLDRIGVPAHKLGAWDTTYIPLIQKVASSGKPVFVDLGPTTEAEIDEMIAVFKAAGGSELLLLHDYHTTVAAQMNMHTVPYLAGKLPWPVGYSSPGRDDDIDLVAVGLGARYIEKRLILDRSHQAFHADESMHPDELASWVKRIRRAEEALGRYAVVPSEKDLEGAKKYYRSVCTISPVKAGEIFSPDNLDGKRPGTGLHTRELTTIWGRKATRDLSADELLTEKDFI